MALSISKTLILDDEYPPGGSYQGVKYNPLTAGDTYIYSTGAYSLTDQKSRAGTAFIPAGDPDYPELWPTGVVQSAYITLYHSPFVCNSLRFPFNEDDISAAYVDLSSGSLTFTTDIITWILSEEEPDPGDIYAGGYRADLGVWNYCTRVITEAPSGFGCIGVSAIVNESGTLRHRVIAASGVGSTWTGGAVDITPAIQAMKKWSGGKCFGFEWFLVPGNGQLLDVAWEGTEEGLRAILASSSTNNISYDAGDNTYEGAASCYMVEYNGFGWQSGKVLIDTYSMASGSAIPPAYPRFDQS